MNPAIMLPIGMAIGFEQEESFLKLHGRWLWAVLVPCGTLYAFSRPRRADYCLGGQGNLNPPIKNLDAGHRPERKTDDAVVNYRFFCHTVRFSASICFYPDCILMENFNHV